MAMNQCVLVFSVLAMLQSIAWCAQQTPSGSKPVVAKQALNEVTLANGIVTLKVDSGKPNITVTDAASGAVMVDNAWVADGWGGELGKTAKKDDLKNWTTTVTVEPVEDAFGKGQRAVVTMTESKRAALPTYLFSYSLYENVGAVFMGFGLRNQTARDVRLMSAAPMIGAKLMPGATLENLLTLNGAAGAEATHVKRGPERASPNSLIASTWNAWASACTSSLAFCRFANISRASPTSSNFFLSWIVLASTSAFFAASSLTMTRSLLI